MLRPKCAGGGLGGEMERRRLCKHERAHERADERAGERADERAGERAMEIAALVDLRGLAEPLGDHGEECAQVFF